MNLKTWQIKKVWQKVSTIPESSFTCSISNFWLLGPSFLYDFQGGTNNGP